MDPFEWLEEQFEFGFCAKCAGDEFDHFAIPFLGNWLSCCIDKPTSIPEEAESRMLRATRRFHVKST